MPLSLQGVDVTKGQAPVVYQKGQVVAASEEAFNYQSAPSLAQAYPDLVFKNQRK